MNTRPPRLVDTLHTRLLVDNYSECFRFYQEVLPALTGAKLAKGEESGPYARWDLDDEQPLLALLDRAAMAAMLDSVALVSGESVVLVFRVADTDAAQGVCERHGGTVVSPAEFRPEWGPDTRIAYLRDPGGNLVELQASPD